MPKVHFLFSNFIEFVAHIYSAQALESQGHPKGAYYQVPVRYTRRLLEQQGTPVEMDFAEHVRTITEQCEMFREEITNLDPVTDFGKVFETFLRAYARDERAYRTCLAEYQRAVELDKIIKRRDLKGDWSELEPRLNNG